MTRSKKSRRLSEAEDRAFEVGVNCALAIVHAFDQETIWREIVNSCGGHERLHRRSRLSGNLRIDGFAHQRAARQQRLVTEITAMLIEWRDAARARTEQTEHAIVRANTLTDVLAEVQRLAAETE